MSWRRTHQLARPCRTLFWGPVSHNPRFVFPALCSQTALLWAFLIVFRTGMGQLERPLHAAGQSNDSSDSESDSVGSAAQAVFDRYALDVHPCMRASAHSVDCEHACPTRGCNSAQLAKGPQAFRGLRCSQICESPERASGAAANTRSVLPFNTTELQYASSNSFCLKTQASISLGAAA